MEERTNSPAARLYRSMYLIRRVEEEIIRLYPSDKIKSPVHLSIGQEAVSAAVCDHLEKSDVLFGTYRGHALYLAKGGDVPRMMAELYGKVDGCARGKAGSMHLVDPSVNMMGTSAVVATGISNAVGAALALKMQKSKAIVVCFFGEGATDEGAWHESMNFASLKKLPILFVCENNFYGIGTEVHRSSALADIHKRTCGYDVPSERVDGMDVMAVHEAVKWGAEWVREQSRPYLIEALTYRFRGHSMADPGKYRSAAEVELWKARDPLPAFAIRLIEEGIVTQAELGAIKQESIAIVQEAVTFAEESPWPEDGAVWEDIYV